MSVASHTQTSARAPRSVVEIILLHVATTNPPTIPPPLAPPYNKPEGSYESRLCVCMCVLAYGCVILFLPKSCANTRLHAFAYVDECVFSYGRGAEEGVNGV